MPLLIAHSGYSLMLPPVEDSLLGLISFEINRKRYEITFVVDLTGVGKRTTLAALRRSKGALSLLPNRREFADTLIIPEMQRAGEPKQKVADISSSGFSSPLIPPK